ncbi:MAG: acetylxylan esterase [Clostridia bacterium]|nr:acetylxylan esterase [Clostridia bacterium]
MKLHSLDEIKTPVSPASLGEWEELKRDLIANLRFASAIDLLKHDAPLQPKVFGAVEFPDFIVEKVIFQSLPGFYVAGNLYRPKDISRKYPAVLNPHGHWENGRVELSPLGRLPQRCANFAMRGMVAFIYDMVGWNDSSQIDHNGYLPEFEDWNFSHFALQLNNSVKALDFVSSLPYVDASRIGCTGCSGGGTQTWFLSMLDERVKAAAPINMVSAYMQGGCGCENAPFLRTKYCSVDYAMCIAPRPLFMAASDGDWTVHSREVEFPAVRRVYELYGAADRFETFYRSAPHSYDKPTREHAYDFFCRAFGLDNPYGEEIDMDIDPQDLLIGDIRPHVETNGFIQGEDALFSLVKRIMRNNLAKLDKDACAEIMDRVFPELPADELDIQYLMEDPHDIPELRLGECPAAYDTMRIKHFHAYNPGWDTRRISALRTLIKAYPDRMCVAKGKSAYLAGIAAKLAGSDAVRLSEPDAGDLDVPGIELARNLPDSPIS